MLMQTELLTSRLVILNGAGMTAVALFGTYPCIGVESALSSHRAFDPRVVALAGCRLGVGRKGRMETGTHVPHKSAGDHDALKANVGESLVVPQV